VPADLSLAALHYQFGSALRKPSLLARIMRDLSRSAR
jgi:hypothetical protein